MPTYLELLKRFRDGDPPTAIIYDGEIYYYNQGDDYRNKSGKFLSDEIGVLSVADHVSSDVIEYFEESIPISWLHQQGKGRIITTDTALIDELIESWRRENE